MATGVPRIQGLSKNPRHGVYKWGQENRPVAVMGKTWEAERQKTREGGGCSGGIQGRQTPQGAALGWM